MRFDYVRDCFPASQPRQPQTPREGERLKATLTLRTRLFLRELREPIRDGERERTVRNNAYAGVTNPVCTASQAPYPSPFRKRRGSLIPLLRLLPKNAASRHFRGPLLAPSGAFIFAQGMGENLSPALLTRLKIPLSAPPLTSSFSCPPRRRL